MEQTVYGDILFIINFCMDFVALYITAKILHIRPRAGYLILSSSMGAVYSVASMFFSGGFLLSLAIDISVSALMCFVAFKKTSGRTFLISWFLFFAVSALLGGTITAMYSLINSAIGKRLNVTSPEEAYSGLPANIFVIIAIVSVILTYAGGRLLGKTSHVKTIEVTVTHGKKSVTFTALSDSGNLLCEPVSGRPAILVGYDVISSVIPYEVLSLIRTGSYEKMSILSAANLRRTRLIPAKGIGDGIILIGFVPDKITVKKSGRGGIRTVDAIIAVDAKRSGDYSGCEGIISPSLIGA